MAEIIKDISENIEEHPEDIDPTSTYDNKKVDSECVVLANDKQCSGDDDNDKYKMNNVEDKSNDNEIKNETNDKVDEKCNIESEMDTIVQEEGTEQDKSTKSNEGTCNDEIERCTTDVSLEQSKTLQSTHTANDTEEKNDAPETCEADLPTVSKKLSHTTQTDDDDSDEDIYLYMYPQMKKEAYVYDDVDNIKHGLQGSNVPVVPPPIPTAPRPPIDVLKPVQEHTYQEIDDIGRKPGSPSSNINVTPPPLPTSPRPQYKSKRIDTTKEMLRPLRIIDSSQSGSKVANTSLNGPRKVLIDGVPKDISIKEVGVSIETELLINGEDLEEITLNRTLGEAILTLKSASVADELVKRSRSGKAFLLKDSSTSISPYQEASVETSKIFLLGLNEDSNTQEISNLIQTICGLEPLCVIKGENRTIALLGFKSPQDLKQLQDKLKQSADDIKLETFPVKQTQKVKVKDVTKETAPEELKHYFDQLSKHGSVLSVKYRDNWDDHIITFSSVEDADIVVNKDAHTVKDAEIKVSLYYPFLDGDEEYVANIPVPFKLDGLNTYICRFLQESPQSRKDFEEILEDHYGSIIWPEDGAERKVYVQCNINEQDRMAAAKVRDWKENVTGILAQICKMFSVQIKYFAVEGRKKKVDGAILKVKSIVQDFQKQDIKDISPMACSLLRTNKTRNYVKQKMADSRITGVWRFTEMDILQLYSVTKEELRNAEKSLRSCFRSTQIKIETRMKEYFQKGDHLTNLIKEFAGDARYKISGDVLDIVTLDSCHDEAVEKVKKFIDLHTIVSEEFLLDPGQFRFIFSYKKKSIGEIVQQYKDMNVEIDVFDKPTRKGFLVKGEREGCKTAIAHLRRFVIDGITRIDHQVNSDELSKYLRTSQGINELNRIELSGKCVIRISTPDPNVISPKLNQRILSGCTIGTCEVQIIKGDITDADVDFVVNPVDISTDQKYGLARTLIDKGGFVIQKACQDHISKTNRLKDGDTFITSSGCLPCRGIIHVVLPTWAKVVTDKEATISNVVTKCLKEAEENETSSIAFPPLGAGRFRYPSDVIAERMIRSVKRYLMENGADTSLKHVYIYDVAKESSLFLVRTMRKEIPLSNIMIPEMLTGGNEDELDGEYLYPEIVIGSLVNQDTDVIVNTTNGDLNLQYGSLSKAILKEGGKGIESELKEKYPGGISPGEVAETKGGNLKCNAVFHGVLVKWDHDQGHAEKVMTCFVQNCLSAAIRGRYDSIAFPVLASGARLFPHDRIAKIMFKAIDAFKEENPVSSLKTVRIVIQPEDKEAIQVFEEYKMPYNRQQRISKLSFIHNIQGCRPESVFIDNTVPNFTTKIGNVTLSIEQGDITQANTAVIVNSVREDLNLDSGKISRSILRASGRTIQFQANEHRDKFKKDLLVTTSSGSLFCQKIIHVRARNGFEGWKKTFARSLAEVEKMSLNSVAFPALGTGGKGFPVNEMARTMIHAFQKYIRGETYQGYLKSIKIILYDAEMVDIFTREVKASLKTEQRMSFFFKFWESKSEEESSSMVFHIYTDTADAATYVQLSIDQLRQETGK